MNSVGGLIVNGSSARGVVSRLSLYGFGLALLAVLVMMLAGLGSRWGWWHFRVGFAILKWGAYGGLAAGLISLAGLLIAAWKRYRPGLLLGGVGLVIGLLAVATPWSWRQAARSVPPIHDITTDAENPPQFVAVLPLRDDAPNPAEYGGPEVAVQQRAAYPDLGPVTLPVSPELAFQRVLLAAREMGWEVVDADATEGRIESTDTTFWFGFKDDVVVRITPVEGGSRIDVRSVSRVGKSDVGTNAKRIRKFLKTLISYAVR
jgi:uncharacterized protein (DUF1499 family)